MATILLGGLIPIIGVLIVGLMVLMPLLFLPHPPPFNRVVPPEQGSGGRCVQCISTSPQFEIVPELPFPVEPSYVLTTESNLNYFLVRGRGRFSSWGNTLYTKLCRARVGCAPFHYYNKPPYQKTIEC